MPAAAEAVPQPTPVTMPAPVSVALPVPLSVPAPVSMSAAGEPILISGSAPALLTSSASALASVSTSYASATPPPISGVGVDHGLLALSLGGLAGLGAALATLPAQASGGRVDTGGSGGGIGYSTQGGTDDSFTTDPARLAGRVLAGVHASKANPPLRTFRVIATLTFAECAITMSSSQLK